MNESNVVVTKVTLARICSVMNGFWRIGRHITSEQLDDRRLVLHVSRKITESIRLCGTRTVATVSRGCERRSGECLRELVMQRFELPVHIIEFGAFGEHRIG